MNMLGKIRRLHFRDGLSIKEICRRTGLARNTVRQWLRAGEGAEPKYRRTARETAPALPERSAPPLPYVYLGQYRDADGIIVLYLRRGDSVIVAKPGTQLDEAYRLEAEIDGGLTFTYLPLNEAQIIPIRNPAL